jgi:glycosyltransferase involved in cell wall biosynthesis
VSRILITGFCGVPGPHRAGVQLRHLIRALTPVHAVDVLAVREGDQAYVERQGAVRILRVPSHDADPTLQIQAFQRALKRQLEGADYNVVHCRDPWSCATVLEARPHLDVAVVYDVTRGPAPIDHRWAGEQFERDEEACVRAADLVLAPTEHAVRHLARTGGRVLLSPAGVDIDRFDWEDAAPGQRARILYAGAVGPGRGLRTLVRAVADLARAVDVELVVAGPIEPGFEPQLRTQVRDVGLAERVQILGPVEHEQMPTLIATARVCVAPGASDLQARAHAGPPSKILEYLACRRPVVAVRRGAVGLVVEHGREALLFPPGDPVALAAALRRIIEDPALADRLAQAGYQRIRRDGTASASRRALRRAYADLMRRFPSRFESVSGASEERVVELIADDDFEATVFEEAPVLVPDAGLGDTGVETRAGPGLVQAAPEPVDRDETGERSGAVTGLVDTGSLVVVSASTDEWVVGPVAEVGRSLEDEGTPLEGISAATPAAISDNRFVAGEIDVPGAPLDLLEVGELTAASALLSGRDADTGETGPGR